MRKKLVLLASIVACATSASAQQATAAAAVNSARYGIKGLPGYGVAPGSLATLFGTNYPATPAVFGDKGETFPLKTNWENVTIDIQASDGSTYSAYPLILQGAGQMSFIVPSNVPAGDGQIRVNGGAGGPITILSRNFGIFTTNFTGSGPAVIQDPVRTAAAGGPVVNSLGNAANPGELLDIWGTGLGAIDPALESSANVITAGDQHFLGTPPVVHVFVGGIEATDVPYKGRSGCCAALDQVRFRVPQGVSGCYVPLYLTVDGVVSNFTTLSVAPTGRTCSDSGIGYSADDIARAASASGLKTGEILLSRSSFKLTFEGIEASSTTDSGFGSFQKWTSALLNQSNNAGLTVTPIGSCTVYTQRSSSTTPSEAITIPELDAGPALTVTSQGGVSKQMTKPSGSIGTYFGSLGGGITVPGVPLPGSQPPFLDPGVFTISGPGGADVGPFSVQVAVPQTLTWTNMDSISTVNRSQDLPIQFSGGGNGDLVVILGFSSISEPADATATFVCTTHATGGPSSFTVPSAVLQQLPANPATDPTNPVPTGLIALGTTTSPVPFTPSAPTIDKGFAVSSVSTGKLVTFQ